MMKRKKLICLSLAFLLGMGTIGAICISSLSKIGNMTHLVQGDGDNYRYYLSLDKNNKINFDEDTDSSYVYTTSGNQIGMAISSSSEYASGLLSLTDGVIKNLDPIHDIKSMVVNYSGSGSLKGYLGFYAYGVGGGVETNLTSGNKFTIDSPSSYFALISIGEVNIESIDIAYDCTIFTKGPDPIKVSISELNEVIKLANESQAYKGALYEIEGGLSSFIETQGHGKGTLTDPISGDSIAINSLGGLKSESNPGMYEADFVSDKCTLTEVRSFSSDPNHNLFKDGVYLTGYALLSGEYTTNVTFAVTEFDIEHGYTAITNVTGEKDKFKGITYKVNDEEVTSFKYGDKVSAALSFEDGYGAIVKVNGETVSASSGSFFFTASTFNKIEIEVKAKSDEPELLSTYTWGLKSAAMAGMMLKAASIEGEEVISSLKMTGWKAGKDPDYLYSNPAYTSGDHSLTLTLSNDVSRVVIVAASDDKTKTLTFNEIEKTIESNSVTDFVNVIYDVSVAKGGELKILASEGGIHIKSMSFYGSI